MSLHTHEQWKLYLLDREPRRVDYAEDERQTRIWRSQHKKLLLTYWGMCAGFVGLCFYGLYRATTWVCLNWWWR